MWASSDFASPIFQKPQIFLEFSMLNSMLVMAIIASMRDCPFGRLDDAI
jgi:hypothetical protein